MKLIGATASDAAAIRDYEARSTDARQLAGESGVPLLFD